MEKNSSKKLQTNCCQCGCSGCPYFFGNDPTIPFEFKDVWENSEEAELEPEEA